MNGTCIRILAYRLLLQIQQHSALPHLLQLISKLIIDYIVRNKGIKYLDHQLDRNQLAAKKLTKQPTTIVIKTIL